MEFHLLSSSSDPPFSAMEDWLSDDDIDRSSWEELVKLWLVDELIRGHSSSTTSKQRSRAVFLAIDLFDFYLSENNDSFSPFFAWPTSPITVPNMEVILSFFLSVLVTCASEIESTIRHLMVDPKWNPLFVIKMLDFLPLALRIKLIPLWGDLLVCYLTNSCDKSLSNTSDWRAISFFRNIPLHHFKPILPTLMSTIRKNPYNIDTSDIFDYILSSICSPRDDLDFLFLLRDILLQCVDHFDNYNFSAITDDYYHFFHYLNSCTSFFYHFDRFNSSENNIFDFLGELVVYFYDSGSDISFQDKVFEIIYPLALSNPAIIPFLPYFVKMETYHGGFYLSRAERKFFSDILSPEAGQQFLAYLVLSSGYFDEFPDNQAQFSDCLKTIPLSSVPEINSSNLASILPHLRDDLALIVLFLTESSFPSADKIYLLEHLSNHDQWLDFLLPRLSYYTNLAFKFYDFVSCFPDHIYDAIFATNYIKNLFDS